VAFLTPRTSRSPKAGQSEGVAPEIEPHRDRQGQLALHRLDGVLLEPAHVGGREVARDAVHAGAVRAVGA